MGTAAALRRRRAGPTSVGRRLFDDTHVLLAIAIALAATIIELANEGVGVPGVAVFGSAYVALQVLLGWLRGPLTRPIVRLFAAVGFVSVLNMLVGDLTVRPMATLYVPIVAMAAAYGWREAIVIGTTAIIAYALPIWVVGVPTVALFQRAVALGVTAAVVVLGSRRTVDALESAIARARTARTAERRHLRRMAGIEDVGRLLAAGISPSALDELVGTLQHRFDYEAVSIYLLEDDGCLHLGAQRGYETVIESFDGSTGIVGRVMRTRESALVRDVRDDPDYVCAKEDVRSEVSVPLIAEGEIIGVLNVEDSRLDRLDDGDRSTVQLIGERLAGAIALGRDRRDLTDRAALFQALAEFSRSVSASTDRATLQAQIVDRVATMLRCDIVVLSIRDGDREYRIAKMHGGDQRYVGISIPVGEGLSGIAIAEQRLVVDAHQDRARFPSTVRDADSPDVLTSAAAPLLSEDGVLGALAVSRVDIARPFNALELEVLPIVAAHVALALVNAELDAQLADAAIRDPLTGLYNRRHLDASLTRLFASRDRLDASERRPVAAIMFDLDHFGNFNKKHGHRVGDAVLRMFASILEARFRASDIVSRFGGEEFLVILDGASLTEAMKIADEVRLTLEATPIPIDDDRSVHATVSAGCSAVGPDISGASSLIQVADVGLQMAKRAGRNQIVAA